MSIRSRRSHARPGRPFLVALAICSSVGAAATASSGDQPAAPSLQNSARNVTYEGGDGSTMEAAIVIKGVQSDEQGTMAELAFIGGRISRV